MPSPFSLRTARGMVAKLVNLAVLGLLPLAWMAPLAATEDGWFFSGETITVLSGVRLLYEQDPVLAALIALFAIVTPFLKSVFLVYAQFSDSVSARMVTPVLEFLGRFGMTDIFLLAFYILAFSGAADLHVEWGAYFFTVLVLASIWSSWATMRQKFRLVPRDAVAV